MSYKCIRCNKEREIPGFCEMCYLDLYGLNEDEVFMMRMDGLIPNQKHLTLVERDDIYTDMIRQSIIKDGLKNPIIINEKGIILIGHHRYYIGMELGWEHIPCCIVKSDAGYNKFIEGGINNIFIVKVDGKIVASITHMDDLKPILDSWILVTPFWKTSHLVLEAFTGIGGSNDSINWKQRNQDRCGKIGGKRNLAKKR